MRADTLSESQNLPADIEAVRWSLRMPREQRKRWLAALIECSDEVQHVVVEMIKVIENPNSTELERTRAYSTIRDALDFQQPYGTDLAEYEAHEAANDPEADRADQRMESQEAAFADKLRDLLKSKGLTQAELASRVGCSQPAISQMLNRACRPQRQTILRLAKALDVDPRELWPDLEVAQILDAVAAAQQKQVMSDAEAEAFQRALERPAAKVPSRPLPKRKR